MLCIFNPLGFCQSITCSVYPQFITSVYNTDYFSTYLICVSRMELSLLIAPCLSATSLSTVTVCVLCTVLVCRYNATVAALLAD